MNMMQEDIDPKVKAYLDAMREQQMRSQDTQDELSNRGSTRQIDNTMMSGIAGGLAQMGTVGGKSASAEPLQNTLSGLNQQQSTQTARQNAGLQHASDQQGKVYQYLMDKREKEMEKKDLYSQQEKLKNETFGNEAKRDTAKHTFEAGEKAKDRAATLAAATAKSGPDKLENVVKTETAKDLSKRVATKASVANQLRNSLNTYQNASSTDDKVRAGEMMLKTLNSLEGPDAIGEKEAERMGGALGINLNPLRPGPLGRRDLAGFERMVANQIGAIEGGIDANKKEIQDIVAGNESPRSNIELKMQPKMKAGGTAYAAPMPTPTPTDKNTATQEEIDFVKKSLLEDPTGLDSSAAREWLKKGESINNAPKF